MSSIIKLYSKAKNNKICPFCEKLVTINDILNNNFVYSESKRKSKLFAHITCFERRFKKCIK